MPDDLPTTWDADPHTLAKHAILRAYLNAWMPIMSNQSRLRGSSSNILYVDGFSGPGEYKGGEPGSPVIAIETALEHSKDFPVPIQFIFVDDRQDRVDHLEQVLAKRVPEIEKSTNIVDYRIEKDDCTAFLKRYLDTERPNPGPTLVFLDQFGYSDVPMDLIGRIMRDPVCEVFTYFDWKDPNRFITDSSKWNSLNRAFGGDEWKQAVDMPADERRSHLLSSYIRALQNRTGVKYFCYFSMHDDQGRLLYWLFFCTGNLRGLEVMKKAMWSVDATGSFKFSDADDPGQLLLLKGFNPPWLAERMVTEYLGKEPAVKEIEHFVLVDTPCYKYNEALRVLESDGRIDILGAPPDRRKGSFRKYVQDSGVKIRFKS